MTNIRYKPLSKELKAMVEPQQDNSVSRPSLGLEGAVKEYLYIDVSQLVAFKNQARKVFNEDEIQKLSESIKQYGIRQPLTIVRSERDIGKFEVISGERRLRAAILAGLTKVPCIIIRDDEHKAEAIALIENIHRADLHPIELGNAYKKLLDNGVFNNLGEVAAAVSENLSNVSEAITLTELPQTYQESILEKKISSRDVLREIYKAFKENNLKRINKLLGSEGRSAAENFSVLRILKTRDGLNFQTNGLKKISAEEKKELKAKLDAIFEEK